MKETRRVMVGCVEIDIRDEVVGIDGKGVVEACDDTVGKEGNADGDFGFEIKLAVTLVEGDWDGTKDSETTADEEIEMLLVAVKDADVDPDVDKLKLDEDEPLEVGLGTNAISATWKKWSQSEAIYF